MTDLSSAGAVGQPRRVRPGAVVLLILMTVLAFLVVSISHSLAREYGDTTATEASTAARALRDWAVGIVLVTGLSAWVMASARRSRGSRTIGGAAALVLLLTLVGVPAGAVIGVQQKFAGYPELPSCTKGFSTGPAVPVVRASQAGFVALDHPGPFSGGGSSGIDGCSSQLMVLDHVDVAQAYRDTLARNGWRVVRDEPRLLAATKHGLDLEVTRARGGSWGVWIGPPGLEPRPTQPGEVAPRH